MLSKVHKRIILNIIALLVSAIIWNINASWGNEFYTCLILSTTTYLIIISPFEIYFSFRDIWFERWVPLKMKELTVSKVKISVEGGVVVADLIVSRDREKVKSKNALVIISPGFSDTKETLQYYYLPLAYLGYAILAYDARGMGESKKAGKRKEFLKRIEDYKTILEWISNNEEISNLRIFSVGLSIGATTALCGGFSSEKVKKIVAISAMSNYGRSIADSNLLVKFSYYLRGVNLSPDDDEDLKLSPYSTIEQVKKSVSADDWKKFSEKVLLIHSKNDKIIKFNNFEENKLILESPEENLLVFKKGGHAQKKNEVALVGATIRFFND